MSTKHIEALKLALKGAANYIDALGGDSRKYRQALVLVNKVDQEQPAQQETVAFYVYKPTLPRGHLGNVSDGKLPWVYDQDPSSGFSARMLVTPITSPPASKPWVGLTEFDIDQIPYSCSHADSRLIAYAIEAKLKEKNT